jgi:hypothetical protein
VIKNNVEKMRSLSRLEVNLVNLNQEGCTKGRQQLLANLELSQDFPEDGRKPRELL